MQELYPPGRETRSFFGISQRFGLVSAYHDMVIAPRILLEGRAKVRIRRSHDFEGWGEHQLESRDRLEQEADTDDAVWRTN